MQDQAVRDTKVMAVRLAAWTAGSHWGATGWDMVAGCRPGQEQQTGPPKGGGRMRMLGGDSTGEATGSAAASRVRNAPREAACPAEGLYGTSAAGSASESWPAAFL